MCLYRKKRLVVCSANWELAAGVPSWLRRSLPEDAEGTGDGLINPSPFVIAGNLEFEGLKLVRVSNRWVCCRKCAQSEGVLEEKVVL